MIIIAIKIKYLCKYEYVLNAVCLNKLPYYLIWKGFFNAKYIMYDEYRVIYKCIKTVSLFWYND